MLLHVETDELDSSITVTDTGVHIVVLTDTKVLYKLQITPETLKELLLEVAELKDRSR
jgi:hypothetical protein